MLSHQVETLPVVYITPSYVLLSLCGNYPKLRMTQRKWISFTQPVYIMPDLDKYMLISQCICTYHTNIHLFCNTWYEASFMITGFTPSKKNISPCWVIKLKHYQLLSITPSYALSSLCGKYPKLRMTQRTWIRFFTQPVYIMLELDSYIPISQSILTYIILIYT